jgi:hypothetical protein
MMPAEACNEEANGWLAQGGAIAASRDMERIVLCFSPALVGQRSAGTLGQRRGGAASAFGGRNPLLPGGSTMATRAEQFRSEEQRTHGKGLHKRPHKTHVSKKQPKKAAWSRNKPHAGAKATHALESVARGARPSRESTRASANRAKPDSAFNLTEETKKGAPQNRARKARTRSLKVRGRPRG